jgi:hypothetical protein
MEKPNLDDLMQRVDLLERANRCLRWVCISIVVGAVALVVVGGKLVHFRPGFEAERFVLRDRDGKARGAFALAPDGSPRLVLSDTRGKDLITLQAMPDDTAAVMLFSRGHTRVSMTATPHGSAVLNFIDSPHGTSSGFYLAPDGTLALGFKGMSRSMDLSLKPDGAAKLTFEDPDGKSRGGFGVTADGTAEMLFRDQDGNVVFECPARPEKQPLTKVASRSIPDDEDAAEAEAEADADCCERTELQTPLRQATGGGGSIKRSVFNP